MKVRVGSLVDLIRHRGHESPDGIAYTYLVDGENQEVKLSYGELERASRAIAVRLQSMGAAGKRVLLPFPVGIDYVVGFYGTIMAGSVAVPVYPPKLNQTDERLESIARNSNSEFALTSVDILRNREQWVAKTPALASLKWMATDDGVEADPEQWMPPAVGDESLAVLQYTSGSTGQPKGVMVSHANLLDNLATIQARFRHTSRSVGVIWLPPYHDMGLIGAILQPLYAGFPVVLLSPTSFIQRPSRWLRAITHYQATTSGGPNFAYDLCVRQVSPEERAGLDLSSWDVAFTGAEPCRSDTMEAFSKVFQPCGFRKTSFYPCYGLAEATLYLSGGRKGSPPVYRSFQATALADRRVVACEEESAGARSLVGCGEPAPGHRVEIIDPETLASPPPGSAGEIWISGPSVAQGYWDAGAETLASFQSYRSDTGEGPFLRTGDLGFFEDGELFVAGRLKEVIIVRGRKHSPLDIELTVAQAHPALHPGGVAFSVEVAGEERLVVVQQILRSHSRKLDTGAIVAAIREAVALKHEIHVYDVVLLKPGRLPRTSSGKVQRFAARAAYLGGTLEGKLTRAESAPSAGMEMSLFYFAADAETTGDKYRLYTEGARFADRNGFTAVWTPERHFHAFGGLYPNPSVLSAALAMITTRIRLRAGSVVLPLHDPIRVAEEWAAVDNLSHGRVDLAFARGWNPQDFVLAPSKFTDNRNILFDDIEKVRQLWRGGAITLPDGRGKPTAVKIHPPPVQPDLSYWITCSGGPERFADAGTCGANVLTALLFQSVEELSKKLKVYRDAWRLAGQTGRGHVTLMLHTFVGNDVDTVRDIVRAPFIAYLRTSVDLWRVSSKSLDELLFEEQEDVLGWAFARYFHTAALFGTPESCAGMIEQLKAVGVDEIACLIDFGVDPGTVLANLPNLEALLRRVNARQVTPWGEAPVVQAAAAPAAEAQAGTCVAPILHMNPARLLAQAPVPADPTAVKSLRQDIAAVVSGAVGGPPEQLPLHASFFSMGIDSLTGTQLIAQLGRKLGFTLSPTMLFEAPTIAKLADLLASTHPDVVRTATKNGLNSLAHGAHHVVVEQRLAAAEARPETISGDIAVIGMACRLPQAPDLAAFWELLSSGKDAVCEVPQDRWDWRQWYSPQPGAERKTNSRWGGFIDGIDSFDSLFFAISPREARVMDPQQRLFLEVAWEALEHAGYAPDSLAGSDTGVWVGCSNNGYYQRIALELTTADHHAGLGNQNAIIANRVSFVLDLHGPSVLVDTMCSSSLVALHMACESLRRRECGMALVGGVNLLLQPEYFVAMSRMAAHSPDGRCRAFDHRANGIVLGEGAGTVLLKPLDQAIVDRDTIHAVIRGSAVNHGGLANGLSAPNPNAQEQLIRQAQKEAGVSAEDISYVEAHGTGTALGDPIEIEALTRAFLVSTERKQFCAVGSLKTNIGHLEAAAGIAAFLKVVLALKHQELPPTIHFERPNPLIRFEETPFFVNVKRRPWDTAFPRRAAVSSFGMGGTNAHLIVEEAPAAKHRPLDVDWPVHVLTLSAKSPGALRNLAVRHAASLSGHTGNGTSGILLGNYCFTANAGRSRMPYRAAITGANAEDLRSGLASVAQGQVSNRMGVFTGEVGRQTPKIGFLFTGQGSEYAGMGVDLYRSEPEFRKAVDRCEAALGGRLGSPMVALWSNAAALQCSAVKQPALFALEWALVELWRSWGIQPDAVLGHSLGEYAAACVAGVFSPEEGIRLVLDRGQLMQGLPSRGALLAVLADEASVRKVLEEERGAQAVIAAINSPRNIVIACAEASVERLKCRLEASGSVTVRLDVSHAFHSALLDPILEELEQRASTISFAAPRIPLISNLDGAVITNAPGAQYWRDHARQPVRFMAGIETLAAMNCEIFVEIGPTATLLSLARRIAPQVSRIPSFRKGQDTWTTLADGLAALCVAGAPVDWKAFYRDRSRRRIPLPTYPFERQSHWIKGETTAGGGSHTLLGRSRVAVAPGDGQIWEKSCNGCPDGADIERLIEAAFEMLGGRFELREIEFGKAPEPGACVIRTLVTPYGGDSCQVELWSCRSVGGEPSGWKRYLSCRADRYRPAPPAGGRPAFPDLSMMFFAGSEDLSRDKYRLVLSAARVADRGGFSAVWVPERHFVGFGGLYPNPSVIHAALARETRRVHLRAGSVVLPLHQPLRVAEEWAAVDNLSGGRIGISFASGWNPDDFALAPDRYAARQDRMFEQIEVVRRLWRGETIDATGGEGKALRLRTYPTPVQRELPVWISAAGNPRTFERAGEIGANLLTHLLDQGIEEVAAKIALYRAARASAGYDPTAGIVTLMVHTFIGRDVEEVRERVRGPFTEYLKTLKPLMLGLARSRNRDVDLSTLTPAEIDGFAAFLFDRFFSTRALFGTPASCAELVRTIHQSGVDEVGCLLDFGPPTDMMLDTLPELVKLQECCQQPPVSVAIPATAAPESIEELQRRGEHLQAVDLDGAMDGSLWRRAFEFLARIAGCEPVVTRIDSVTVAGTALGKGWLQALPGRGAAGDIRILCERGSLIAEARGVSLQASAGPAAKSLDGLIYEVRWEPRDRAEHRVAARALPGGWVVIGGSAGVRKGLANKLQLQGGCFELATHDTQASSLESALQMVAPCRGIINLAGLDSCNEVTPESLADDSLGAAESFLHCVQLLVRTSAPPAIWIVTQGAQPVGGSMPLHLPQSTLWGLGRTCALEHPDFWGGLVDLDPAASDEQCVRDLAAELLAPSADAQIGYRHGRRWTATPGPTNAILVNSSEQENRRNVVRPDRAYVVTGGLSGVGLVVAKWLARSGASRLILIGRTSVPPREEWDRCSGSRVAGHIQAIRELETQGVRVDCPALDVADESSVARFLTAWRSSERVPIGGVIHAASVWQGSDGETLVRPLVSLDARAIREVYGPKVVGAWVLHRVLTGEPLDFFVCFSSAASLLGSTGQGNYAGAGTFMDALAHHRRAAGLPSLSINWGPISEVGFGATPEGIKVHQYWQSRGIGRITPAQVVTALERMLAQDVTQAGVMNMNWALLRRSYPQLEGLPWMGEAGPATDNAGLRRKLEEMEPAVRRAFLESYLHEQVAHMLRMDSKNFGIDHPLSSLGFDSLMAIELRNKIANEICITVQIAKFLEGPSLGELAAYVVAQLDGSAISPAVHGAATAKNTWEEGVV